MTAPIESAEAFVDRVQEECTGVDLDEMTGRWLVQQKDRDRAVRAEALREAADWLERCCPQEPSERNEWQQVLVEAAEGLCAIADGAPKSPNDVPIPTLATKEPDDD